MDVPPEDQNSQHGQEDNFNAYRSMRDRMHPPRMSAPSCIVPPIEQLVIQPHIVPLLPTFHGMESENPYSHIKEFEENEKFYERWERYKEAINACPHHGFDTWLLVSYFYDEDGMNQMLERWEEMKSQPNAKGGMYVLNEDMDMKAKVAAMARRLEKLEMKKQGCERLCGRSEVHQCSTESENRQCREYIEQNDGWMQNDMSQKIDNVQYAISRLTNLNTVQEKGKFPSNLIKIPRVSMKWSLKRENLQSIEASESQYPFTRHDQTSANICKKFKDLCTVKRGLNVNKKAFLTEQVSAIIQCKSPMKYKDPGCPHLSEYWRDLRGKSFVRLGSKCEFATLLCLQAIGT
ncbi:hypothetical protein CK203_112890 [Vitis vinifera]|uniref:Retrotransposon gag domain-containing protein n=1 Tax=Vitis vinifera TaxID=29760 RepID=A0A438F1B9_VITVI|nr:hypothetical protein CK203_112890 [Vitis vinifera]